MSRTLGELKVNTTTKKRIVNFLSKVESELCVSLKKEMQRFPNMRNLLLSFEEIRDIDVQLRYGNRSLLNQIVEKTNEICVAKWILDSKRKCSKLVYEPVVKATAATTKTIDFCAVMENGQTIYFDVKTIQPDTINAWDKFERAKKNKQFPQNVNMLLDEKWLGGEIWHDSFSSRARMLEYTVELEGKINNYEAGNKIFFDMVFCSDGFDWRLDKLEDFADFYTTGNYNPDDPFRKMESFYIKNHGCPVIS